MKRIQYIDFLRIISTLAVIVIHTTDEFVLAPNHKGGIVWSAVAFINSFSRFAVPLFIMISGYLHREIMDGKDKIYNLKKYLPLLLWFFLYWVLLYQFQPWKQNNSVQQFILSFIAVNYIHLYFIQVLLGVLIARSIIGVLHKRLYEIKLIYLLLIQIFIWILLKLSAYYHVEIYYYNLLTVGLLYLPTYLMGYQLKMHGAINIWERVVMYFFCLCFILVCFMKSRLILSDSVSSVLISNLSPVVIGFALFLLNASTTRITVFINQIHTLASFCLAVYLIHPLIIIFTNRFFGLELHLLSSNLLFWYGVKIVLVTFISFTLSGIYYGFIANIRSIKS